MVTSGKRVELGVWLRMLVLVLQIDVHKVVTVPAVDGQDDQDEKVMARMSVSAGVMYCRVSPRDE